MNNASAGVKYSYFYNEKGDYTIVFRVNTDEETIIAFTDTAEKAHFIVTAANSYKEPDEEAEQPKEDKVENTFGKSVDLMAKAQEDVQEQGISDEEIRIFLRKQRIIRKDMHEACFELIKSFLRDKQPDKISNDSVSREEYDKACQVIVRLQNQLDEAEDYINELNKGQYEA